MLSKYTILIAGILIFIVAGVFLYSLKQNTSTLPTPSPIPTASSVVLTPQPSSADSESDKNIIVSSPPPNQTLSLPFNIEGQARVFENQFNYRVKDKTGIVLAEGSAYANSPDVGQFGNFKITVAKLKDTKSSEGTIEVFDYSAKDGSEIDKVVIPVKFNI
jgi:germination protein M